MFRDFHLTTADMTVEVCAFSCLSNLVLRAQPFGVGHDSFTPESFTFHPQLHSPCH